MVTNGHNPALYDQFGQNIMNISLTPGAAQAAKILGSRGLKNLAGRVQEEYEKELKNWEDAVEIYIEMRDDLHIGILLDAIKLPLLAADFDVEPGGDSLGDQAAADFLWDNLQNMHRQSWRSHVSDMLEAVDFGFSLAEIVMEKRADGRLYIRNLDPRGQETIDKWEFDSHDHVIGYWQKDPVGRGYIQIPMDKSVHMTFRGRKGNPHGKPLLRDLYRTWRFTKEMENMEGIAIERSVGGMPVVTLPDEPLSDADITALRTALTNLRMDEEMYLILADGMQLTPYSANMNAAPINLVITRKQKEILMRGFAQFIALGMSNVGTQALVKGSQDFFALGLEAVQQQLLEAWNQQLVPYLFRFNKFPGMTELPKINWDAPGKVDIAALMTAYTQASSAGVIKPTTEDEDHFRAIMDLPDRPEDVLPEAGAAPGPLAQSHYQENPDLRSGSGDFEGSTNRTQKRLLTAYDKWAVETRNQILEAQERGIQPEQFDRIVSGRLSQLESELVEIQREGINSAAALVVSAALLSTPRVRNAIAPMIASVAVGVAGLTGSIRDRLSQKLANSSQFDRSSLKEIFDTARASVASSAGVAWAALFTALIAGGREQERQTGRTTRVRWVLNDAAEHCSESAGHFGCPELAGVYNSWSELPTVPAGQVTCRGNCRCVLEVETEPGSGVWKRGLPEFIP